MTNSYESENMRTAQPDKRTRLIETATKLAYGRGFRETSLADIAEAARVPVGNVYYYFKTKEELAEAVVERRLEEFPWRQPGRIGTAWRFSEGAAVGFRGEAFTATGSNWRTEDALLGGAVHGVAQGVAALSRRNHRGALH